jgi:hypothetical protein
MVSRFLIFLRITYYRFFLGKTLYLNKFVDDIPEKLKQGVVYVEGTAGNFWFASLLCPCGCKQVININLDKNESPCWKLSKTIFSDLSPSLWKNNGCKSHFFLKKGEIKWCY